MRVEERTNTVETESSGSLRSSRKREESNDWHNLIVSQEKRREEAGRIRRREEEDGVKREAGGWYPRTHTVIPQAHILLREKRENERDRGCAMIYKNQLLSSTAVTALNPKVLYTIRGSDRQRERE